MSDFPRRPFLFLISNLKLDRRWEKPLFVSQRLFIQQSCCCVATVTALVAIMASPSTDCGLSLIFRSKSNLRGSESDGNANRLASHLGLGNKDKEKARNITAKPWPRLRPPKAWANTKDTVEAGAVPPACARARGSALALKNGWTAGKLDPLGSEQEVLRPMTATELEGAKLARVRPSVKTDVPLGLNGRALGIDTNAVTAATVKASGEVGSPRPPSLSVPVYRHGAARVWRHGAGGEAGSPRPPSLPVPVYRHGATRVWRHGAPTPASDRGWIPANVRQTGSGRVATLDMLEPMTAFDLAREHAELAHDFAGDTRVRNKPVKLTSGLLAESPLRGTLIVAHKGASPDVSGLTVDCEPPRRRWLMRGFRGRGRRGNGKHMNG